MSKHKTPMDWIYDHCGVIVSFERTIDSNDGYEFEALTIKMELVYESLDRRKPYKILTERHLKYTPTDTALVITLDEMYQDILMLLHQ